MLSGSDLLQLYLLRRYFVHSFDRRCPLSLSNHVQGSDTAPKNHFTPKFAQGGFSNSLATQNVA